MICNLADFQTSPLWGWPLLWHRWFWYLGMRQGLDASGKNIPFHWWLEVWNLVVLLFVVCPMILFAFMFSTQSWKERPRLPLYNLKLRAMHRGDMFTGDEDENAATSHVGMTRRYPIRMSKGHLVGWKQFSHKRDQKKQSSGSCLDPTGVLIVFVSFLKTQGRAWVFIISVVCFLYGLGLTFQQMAGHLDLHVLMINTLPAILEGRVWSTIGTFPNISCK